MSATIGPARPEEFSKVLVLLEQNLLPSDGLADHRDTLLGELEKLGYDIESRVPGTGRLRFLEVKGRISGAATITVTKNEILYSLNKPEDFILAIVEFLDGDRHRVH